MDIWILTCQVGSILFGYGIITFKGTLRSEFLWKGECITKQKQKFKYPETDEQ